MLSKIYTVKDLEKKHMSERARIHVLSYVKSQKESLQEASEGFNATAMEPGHIDYWVEVEAEQFEKSFEEETKTCSLRGVFNKAGDLLGFSHYSISRNDTSDLQGLYVSPDHWNIGVGKLLFNDVAHNLKRTGFVNAIEFDVDKLNERAMAFYKSCGALDTQNQSKAIDGIIVTRFCYNL